MKELLIMRHAKSSWDQPYRTDFERPLNKRGRKAAPRMGEFLAERDLLPDLIVSSPAERAKQTADLFSEASGYDGELRFEQDIYHAFAGDLLAVVRGLPDEAERVMLVGHNPGFEMLVEQLCGGDVRMTTAAIAYIKLPVLSWKDVESEMGELQWLVTPKLLD
jgi:phosphohistidine phosphatase